MAQQPLESDQVVVEEGKGQPATATSSNSSESKGDDDSSTKSTVARKYYQVKHKHMKSVLFAIFAERLKCPKRYSVPCAEAWALFPWALPTQRLDASYLN